MKYKNLFIDLDDTLWDTSNNNKECLKEIYADYPFHQHYPSFETFFDDYMPNNLQLWAQYRKGEINKETLIIGRFLKVLEPLGITDKEYILSLNKDFLKRTTLKTKVLPGTFELLEYLRPSFRMFILSNGFREVPLSTYATDAVLKKSLNSFRIKASQPTSTMPAWMMPPKTSANNAGKRGKAVS